MASPNLEDSEVYQPEDEIDYRAPYFDSEFEDAIMQGEELLEEEC